MQGQSSSRSTTAIAFQSKKRGYIESSLLVLVAFATVFFSRILDTLGAPSTINFLHFATVPLACWVAVTTSRSRNPKQIRAATELLIGLFILLTAIVASTLENNAGIVNLVLDYLLLAEPYIFLLAFVITPLSPERFNWLRTWIVRFCFFHTFYAFVQEYILRLGNINPDFIQGVFYKSGAGHVVGASVAITFGLYYLVSAKGTALWIRGCVVLAVFWHMLLADAKQVLLSFIVGWVLLMASKFKDIGTFLKYAIAAILFGYAFLWCVQNIPAFDAFNTWMRPEIYGPDGEATRLKLSSIRIIPTFYDSPLNWLFGLGPGHTVGRLGGWMLLEYWDLLAPLGATVHPASSAVWAAVASSWLGDQSSMFSPLYGWAGIWGDLGFVGLGAYLYLAYVVWKHCCLDDLSKTLMLTTFSFGLIFSQMEEPGYMLFISLIIGLQWQERQVVAQARYEQGRRERAWLEQTNGQMQNTP